MILQDARYADAELHALPSGWEQWKHAAKWALKLLPSVILVTAMRLTRTPKR